MKILLTIESIKILKAVSLTVINLIFKIKHCPKKNKKVDIKIIIHDPVTTE